MRLTEFLNKSYGRMGEIVKFNHYDIFDKAVWHSKNGTELVFVNYENSYPKKQLKQDIAKYSTEVEEKYNTAFTQNFVRDTYIHRLDNIDDYYSRIPKPAQAIVKEYIINLMRKEHLEEQDLDRVSLVVYTASLYNYDIHAVNNEKNVCYHVSSVSPSIVCKEGLNASTAIDRFELGHSYTNAVFMFSVARILDANKYYEKKGLTDRIENDPLSAIAHDMRRYIGKDDDKTWIYKLYLPNEKLIEDTDRYDSSVYVHGRIKAGNIKCIGYFELAKFVKDGAEREALAYYLGNDQRVESIEDILKADVEMTDIDLISNDDMKSRQYNRNVRKMIPAKYYETIVNCYGNERKERDEIINTCLKNGESVKQCVLKLLLRFRKRGDNVYKLLGMKAPYESPKFKYKKPYVAPEARRLSPSNEADWPVLDELDDMYAEMRRKQRANREEDESPYYDDTDYTEDLAEIED